MSIGSLAFTSNLEIEDPSFYEDEPAQVPPSDIVAYNELRSCADLYRMYKQGILDLQPDFQRDFVWKGPEQTRFIDSLIKQLPIPSMCFAMDHKAQRWIVIDGLQRISTVVRFLEGGNWTLAPLDDIDPALAGKSVAEIKTSKTALHDFYTRVENLSIPVTVLRCSFAKKTHLEYLFTIFHRLNTGGVKLNNQEIRNCIYEGSFNNLLKELDQVEPWRQLNKMAPGTSYRFTKQEMILRMLALNERMEDYDGNLAKFLNDYMEVNRNASEKFLVGKRALFEQTTGLIWAKLFKSSAPTKLTVTVLESILVGVSRNLEHLEKISEEKAARAFETLLLNPEFSDATIREGLSKKPRVLARLNTAVNVFRDA